MVQAEHSDTQDTETDEEVFEEAVESPMESDMEISLHALTGNTNGDTIRIPVFLKRQSISILVDTGSTTSFIDCALAAKLNCKVEHTAHMLVTVANGSRFTEDFRLLPLGGCDMVLRADWLRKLGDVVFNLSKLNISFLHDGKQITLTGTPSPPSLLSMSSAAVKNFFTKTAHGLIGQLFYVSTSTPTPSAPPPLLPLLNEFQDIFAEPTSLPPHRALDHYIPLKPDSQPPNLRPYRCPYIQKIDLRDGYHQILVHPADIHKTAFRTHHGRYEFKVMPFGLTNAPATFQTLMNDIFGPYLRKFVLVFFDDILIYNTSMEEHLEHLRIVFSLLRQHQLFPMMSKCSFGQSQLEYLGRIITTEGVCADPQKIADMLRWPTPTSIKQLRGFLGLTGYYRKFVRNYGTLSKPLTDLPKKNSFHGTQMLLLLLSNLKMQ
ncbi:uncharacterized protein LOC113360286 [Papaver somniferum]|uniref:uncharacterized protein LOC113360286 n=1 Tax=Papaver somniferum TaxID=3469 RepID=UPI000E6FEFB1|nr:uncharacterized protein LOC113360286 [Papaver somniferum]